MGVSVGILKYFYDSSTPIQFDAKENILLSNKTGKQS